MKNYLPSQKFVNQKQYENLAYELDYKDVFIVPQYSEITSRKLVDTSIAIKDNKLKLNVPIISANMSSITEEQMCIDMWEGGAIGAMHRFMNIEANLEKYNAVRLAQADCFVSLGVNEESKERAKALYDAGARYFVIDIAHGHSLMMKNKIEWLRKEFKDDIVIMAGNIATPLGVINLQEWGADILKVGIGPGSVCLTKNQTAVTYPQFQAVLNCCAQANNLQKPIPIVADGGIREYGDVCRALAAGATMVMAGGLFAGCSSTPGEVDEQGNKHYYGMASKTAMKLIKREEDMATPEGKDITVKATTRSANDIVKELKGALQSSMSYSNCKTIQEFQKFASFGIRNI